MSISATKVKELREKTQVGMMECKKALVEANGDLDLAEDILLKSGLAKAGRKSDRVAGEGAIFIVSNESNKALALVEVNCETDFVAKNESFVDFGNNLAKVALKSCSSSGEELSSVMYESDTTVDDVRKTFITKLGENIQIRSCQFLSVDDGILVSYCHGSKLATLVNITSDNIDVGRDIAMHIAAMRPIAIDSAGIDSTLIEKEREIFTSNVQDSGKPPEIISKIVDGKINKFLADNTLLGQVFVKDSKQKVKDYLLANKAVVLSFMFCEVGSSSSSGLVTN